jgi:hypothetical protein
MKPIAILIMVIILLIIAYILVVSRALGDAWSR